MARTKQGVFSWEDVLAQRYQSNKPPPLSRPRRRIPNPSQFQYQCHLLSRLSPELRLMIWEYVLGSCQRIHIVQRSGQRLGHVVCPLGTFSESVKTRGNPYCEICTGNGIPQPVKDGDLNRGRTRDMLLGLALTCRQIYHESIHLLYTLTTFEFSNPWSLPYLRPAIPQEHWECIHAIELRWSFPGHWLPSKDPVRAVYVSAGRCQWQETCRVLTRLPALKSFTLVLGNTWFCEPIEKLPRFLEPLRGLRVDRPRASRFDRLAIFEAQDQGFEETGSDDELVSSSRSNLRAGSSLWVSTFPRACSCPVLSTESSTDSTPPSPSPISKVPHAPPTWELRLQGQSYYRRELDRVAEDLRSRGIDCYISST